MLKPSESTIVYPAFTWGEGEDKNQILSRYIGIYAEVLTWDSKTKGTPPLDSEQRLYNAHQNLSILDKWVKNPNVAIMPIGKLFSANSALNSFIQAVEGNSLGLSNFVAVFAKDNKGSVALLNFGIDKHSFCTMKHSAADYKKMREKLSLRDFYEGISAIMMSDSESSVDSINERFFPGYHIWAQKFDLMTIDPTQIYNFLSKEDSLEFDHQLLFCTAENKEGIVSFEFNGLENPLKIHVACSSLPNLLDKKLINEFGNYTTLDNNEKAAQESVARLEGMLSAARADLVRAREEFRVYKSTITPAQIESLLVANKNEQERIDRLKCKKVDFKPEVRSMLDPFSADYPLSRLASKSPAVLAAAGDAPAAKASAGSAKSPAVLAAAGDAAPLVKASSALPKSLAISAAAGDPVAASPDHLGIPPYLICPLGRPEGATDPMRDPVTTPNGETYERDNIERCINVFGIDPVTEKPLTKADLWPNISLRKYIESFKLKAEENHKAGGYDPTEFALVTMDPTKFSKLFANPSFNKEDAVPTALTDVISEEAMIDAMITESGQSYSRETLENLMKAKQPHPETRKPLTAESMRPNLALRLAITDWQNRMDKKPRMSK